MLMTLPESFDTFSDILLSQHTVGELIVKIKVTKDTLNTRQPDYRTTDMSSTLTSPKALTARADTPHGHFRGRGRGGRQSTLRRDNNLLCSYCIKKGHKQENCYAKKKAEEAREERLARRSRHRDCWGSLCFSSSTRSQDWAYSSKHGLDY